MKRLALLLALAGCNEVFALDNTRLVDAGHIFNDAPPDAPPMCAVATVVPRFDAEFHQAVYADQYCSNYQTSAVGLAMATCLDANKQGLFEGLVGPLNGMVKAQGDIVPGAIYGIGLAPEGNEVWVAQYDLPRSMSAINHYQRDATGMWHFVDTPTITYPTLYRISNITRGPRRHLFVIESNMAIIEWKSDDAGVWTQADVYTAADFNTSYVNAMDMSPDGLRVIMYGQDAVNYQQAVFYSHRDTIDSRFGPSVQVPTAPIAQDLFQTADCGRMYFSGVGAVFYVREL